MFAIYSHHPIKILVKISFEVGYSKTSFQPYNDYFIYDFILQINTLKKINTKLRLLLRWTKNPEFWSLFRKKKITHIYSISIVFGFSTANCATKNHYWAWLHITRIRSDQNAKINIKCHELFTMELFTVAKDNISYKQSHFMLRRYIVTIIFGKKASAIVHNIPSVLLIESKAYTSFYHHFQKAITGVGI